MQWSENQENIFKHDVSSGSLLVNAVAGSGKTTTIVEKANRMKERGLFLAFNKSIATELGNKLPPQFPSSTFHSLGFSILRQRLPRGMKVKQTKVKDIMLMDNVEQQIIYPVCQLVSRAKTWGIGYFCDMESIDHWVHLIDSANIEIPEPYTEPQIIMIAIKYIKKSNEVLDIVDFDDMIYLPLLLRNKFGWMFDQQPVIIVDEVQDTNGLQLDMLRALTDNVIGVGDRNQAIYAFRGADHTALDNLSKAFNCSELPLDVSYRCSSAIVDEARSLVPHIKARPGAPDGTVVSEEHDAFNEAFVDTDVEKDVLVVCRTNAPILKLCMGRLRKQKPFTCLSDFPNQLTRYVKGIGGSSIKDFTKRLDVKFDQRIQLLEQDSRHGRIAVETDRYESIHALASECDSVQALTHMIDRILNSKGGPKISTIHKSKGLEADSVVFYRTDLCPAPWVVKRYEPGDSEYEQEENLQYVGITRAKDNLIYVGGEED